MIVLVLEQRSNKKNKKKQHTKARVGRKLRSKMGVKCTEIYPLAVGRSVKCTVAPILCIDSNDFNSPGVDSVDHTK